MLDSSIYERMYSTSTGINLYNNKYIYPFGMFLKEKDTTDNFGRGATEFQLFNGTSRTFDFQNCIAESLLGNDLFEVRTYPRDTTEIDLKADNDEIIYLYTAAQDNEYTITVNGDDIAVPTLDEPNNKTYPAVYNSGILCLGHFGKGSRVDIKLNGIINDDIQCASLDCEKMQGSIPTPVADITSVGHSSLDMTVENKKSDNQMLFIPISFDDGWHCMIDGKKANVEKLYGNFIGVSIPTGVNRIKLNFVPQGLIIGVIISIATLMLAIVLHNRNTKITGRQMVLGKGMLWAIRIFLIIFLLLIIVNFVLSFCSSVKGIIKFIG